MKNINAKVELERQLLALDQLTKTDGWTLLSRSLEASEAAAYAAMLKEPSSETAKHFGAYNAIKDIKEWPERAKQILLHRLRTEFPGGVTGSTGPKR